MVSQNNLKPLLYTKVYTWIITQYHRNKAVITTSVIVSLLAYLFAFTNKLVNGDEVGALFSKGATTSSGRWGLELLYRVFPNYSMPWLHGVLTISLMAIAVCLIISIFQIRSKTFQVLLTGCIIAFPSLIGTFAYMFTSSSYGLSFLLAVLSVWCLQKKGWHWFLAALACLVFSLSIYQAYISIAASLLVLVLIRQLLQTEKTWIVLRRGCFFVAFLILSLGAYYLTAKLVLSSTGSGFNSYAGDAIQFSIDSIPRGILNAYYCFFGFFTEGFYLLIPTALSRWIHMIAVAACVVLFFVWVLSRKEKEFLRILVLAALIAILPLAINCMYLFVAFDSIHTLVLYSFVAVYILAVLLVESCLPVCCNGKIAECARRTAVNLVVLGLAFSIVCNVFIANQAYLQMYLEYETTYAFYSSLVTDIRQTPEFTADTRLAVIGDYKPAYIREYFGSTSGIAGIDFGVGIGTKQQFLHYYLGFNIPFASEEEVAAIRGSTEFARMEVYPYHGSMQMMGDILVVKLS